MRRKPKYYHQIVDEQQRKRYIDYERGAFERKMVFFLTIKQFKSFWKKPCFYCGSKIETIGLDRIDSRFGYTIDNIVSCCWPCNRMKGGLHRDEFVQQCARVVTHFGNR